MMAGLGMGKGAAVEWRQLNVDGRMGAAEWGREDGPAGWRRLNGGG